MPLAIPSIRSAPKLDLHDHLDGGLRPSTLVELAADTGMSLPTTDPEVLGRWFVEEATGDGLTGYGSVFALTVAVMQTAESLARVAAEAITDLADDGVVYAELRFAPSLHTSAGLSMDTAVEAVLDGIGRAHVPQLTARVILCHLRSHAPDPGLADVAQRWRDHGVVAIDLAGPEHGHPARDHRELFERAARHGLGVTVHAGEADGVDSIRQALDCGTRRLGHGVRIIEDVDEATGRLGPVAQRVHAMGAVLEVCPTSNVQTGVAPDIRGHPVERLRRLGFKVTVHPDSRLVSGVSTSDEIERLAKAFDYDDRVLAELAVNALEAAFDPPAAVRLTIRDFYGTAGGA